MSGSEFRSNPDGSNHELWRPRPERIGGSHLKRFLEELHVQGDWSGRGLSDDVLANRDVIESFHRWSIENPGKFWRGVWEYGGLLGELGDRDSNQAENLWEHRFFPEGKLNFAENMLKPDRGDRDGLAVVAMDEGLQTVRLTFRELSERVYQLARCIESLGIEPGD